MGVAEDHLAAALALHGRISGTGNYTWSPYSVVSALGLTAEAASDETYDELVAVLSPDGQLGVIADALTQAADLPGAGIAVTNTLWAADGLPIEPAYAGTLHAWPGGAAKTAGFANDPEGSRQRINADVHDTTHGLIRDLLPPGAILPETIAVLVSALWLKTGWLAPFPGTATEDHPFHAPSGTRDVPAMRLHTRLGYAAQRIDLPDSEGGHVPLRTRQGTGQPGGEGERSAPHTRQVGWQVVRLAATGGVVADVLLPDGDLAAAEATLTAPALAGLLAAVRSTDIDLSLPRFRVEGESRLGPPLHELGVRRLFTRSAELTRLTPHKPVWVDEVLHKAVLRVDEQGLEGAAATAVLFRTVSAMIPKRPVTVRVDRPFLVLVRHAATGTVYFMARVVEP